MRKFTTFIVIFLTVYAGIRAKSFFSPAPRASFHNLLFSDTAVTVASAVNEDARKKIIKTFGSFSTPNPYSDNKQSFNRHYTSALGDNSDKVIAVAAGDILEFRTAFRLNHELVLDLEKKETVPVSVNGRALSAGGILEGEENSTLRIGPFKANNLVTALYLAPVEPVPAANIIFIVLDAYRADNLSWGITPGLENLSGDSVWFQKNFVNSAWTRPSTMIFFTGKYASRNIINFWDYPVSPLEKKEFYQSGIMPLPAILSRNGYHSVMIGNNPFLTDRRYMGVDNGFENVTDFSVQETDTPLVTAKALSFISKIKESKRPVFLFLNYNDPHAPYTPPAGFRERIAGKIPASFPEKRKNYLAEAAYTDNELAKIISELKKQGIYDSSLIVVTSDHGEVMNPGHAVSKFTGTRTLYGHGQGLYTEDIHTPLIIKFPGNRNAGKKISLLSRSIDIFPTILEISGLSTPYPADGRSLLSMIQGKEKNDREYYGETRATVAVIQDGLKLQKKTFLFHRPGTAWNGEVGEDRDYLFDLENDPEEISPLADKNKTVQLNRKLAGFLPEQNVYSVRFYNPAAGKNESEYKMEVKISEGRLVKLSGEGDVSSDGKRISFRKNLPPGQKADFKFRVYPDVSFPVVSSWIDGKTAGRGMMGVGELDIYPNGCSDACAELYQANHSEPMTPGQKRIQFWKTGRMLTADKVVLEKGAMEILKKQGYIH